MITTQEITTAEGIRNAITEAKLLDRPIDYDRLIDRALTMLEEYENGETEEANDGLTDEIQSIKKRVNLFFETGPDDKEDRAIELLSTIQDELKYY